MIWPLRRYPEGMPRTRRDAVEPARAIALRVRVVDPPAGIRFSIQGKMGEFLQQVLSDGRDLVFETEILGVLV